MRMLKNPVLIILKEHVTNSDMLYTFLLNIYQKNEISKTKSIFYKIMSIEIKCDCANFRKSFCTSLNWDMIPSNK